MVKLKKKKKEEEKKEEDIKDKKKYLKDHLTAKSFFNLSEKQNEYYNSIVLICYEKPDDFCHRHLVANWFNENGVNCKEWIN